MKHHFCGRHAIFEGDEQSLERENHDPNRLKLPLLHRQILDVKEPVMLSGCGRKRTHTANCVIADKLWGNTITAYHGVISAGRAIDFV